MDIVDGILLGFQELGNAVGRRCGVVATHGDQQLDVIVLEQAQVEILLKILVGGFEAAHLEIAATPVEIGVCLEEIDLFRARRLGEQTAVTAMQADYPITLAQEGFCYRHNHGVHTRSRAAATEDDDGIFHNCV